MDVNLFDLTFIDNWLNQNSTLWLTITFTINGCALYLLTELKEHLVRRSIFFGIVGSCLLVGVAVIYWHWWWVIIIPYYAAMWVKFYALEVLGYTGAPVFKSRGKHRTDMIADATVTYLVKGNWSVYSELTLDRKRFDLLAIDEEATILGVEIKQSNSDFYNDHKWPNYLPYCHLFYFAFPYDMWEAQKEQILEHIGDKNIGVLVLEKNGQVKEQYPAKYKSLGRDVNYKVILTASRRGGMCSNNWLPTRNVL